MRIGVLGAARINRSALLGPSRFVDGIEVAAIAARHHHRAERYARRHGVPLVLESYAELLSESTLDAVYVPLPASLHGRWTLAALAAGKHVLCEKPFTANADEARDVAAAAATSGLVVMEAHHTTFHPFTARLRELIPIIGPLRSASAWFHAPIPPGRSIRWNYSLGGGSLMDLGVYPLRMVRDVLGEPRVTSATALSRGQIDRRMIAQLSIDDVPITIDCGMWSSGGFGTGMRIEGSLGTMRVSWPYHPQVAGRVRIDGLGLMLRERANRGSTYQFQLEAFRNAVENGGPNLGSPASAVATMELVDEIYRVAGLLPRRPFAEHVHSSSS